MLAIKLSVLLTLGVEVLKSNFNVVSRFILNKQRCSVLLGCLYFCVREQPLHGQRLINSVDGVKRFVEGGNATQCSNIDVAVALLLFIVLP